MAGCSAPDQLRAQWVDLPDGRVVTCVYSGDLARALSCDWAHAALEGEQP